MIPAEVTRLYDSVMEDIEGEPFLRGTRNGQAIYGYRLAVPMCLGHLPIVIGEGDSFRIATWSEMVELENDIREGKLASA